MATVLRAQRTTLSVSCRRRPRTYCVSPRATSAVSSNHTSRVSPAADGAALQQRSLGASSYVNFKATATDFASVIARLEAMSALPANARAAIAAAAATVLAPQRSAWGGIVDGLFGGRDNKQEQQKALDTLRSTGDGLPLSHAVVMFTATWCGPCSMVYRELKLAADRLQGRPPTAVIVVDVEEEKDLASQLGIKALPTLLYLGPDGSRGPIFTQGPVSASFILDTLDRAAGFAGYDVRAKWLKL